jgi:hypothetical protein
MSSKEAMPDDVRMVEDENGEARVAGRRPTVLELDFLLKVDMILDNAVCRTLDNRRTGGAGSNCPISSHTMTVLRRLRPPIVGALYVRFPPFLARLS